MNRLQRLGIRIFNLHDTDTLLKKVRARQREVDRKEFDMEMRTLKEQHERDMEYLIHEKDSEIDMYVNIVKNLKQKEKDQRNLEYITKVQIKDNQKVALDLYMHIKNIMTYIAKECGEIEGVKDLIENHKRKIEKERNKLIGK